MKLYQKWGNKEVLNLAGENKLMGSAEIARIWVIFFL